MGGGGGGANRCLKILVLVTLIPVALKATSLLLSGHDGDSAPAAISRRSRRVLAGQPAGLTVSSASSMPAHKAYPQMGRQRRRRTTESAVVVRRVGGGDWFQDDKRLAPTGSNPLHNLRR